MAGLNIGNANLTRIRYLDGVTETLNQESKARNLIRQDDPWTGTHTEFRVHSARNPAIGYVQDGGAFPTPDKQDHLTAKVGRKFLVGAIQLTDGVMATAAKGPNVVVDAITSEVEGMMKGLLKFENGMFFRSGTGVVATVQAGSATTSLLVDDARMMWDKATYDVYSAAGVFRGTVTVSRVASAPTAAGFATVTLTANMPAATVATDLIVWKDSYNRAITGLAGLVDDAAATFQNINCITQPRYTSFVLDNSGTARALEPLLFRQLMAGLYQKAGGDRPVDGLKVLCSSWQAINVEELYESELRLTPETNVAGVSVAAFQSAMGRVDIIVDSDATYGTMFFIDPSKIYRGVQKQLSWRKNDGGGIFQRSDAAGIYTATAIEIAEMYIKERHTSGKIEDLSESARCMF